MLLAEPTTLIPLPVVDNLSQPMRKWIQKPNSLCFGIGSITVLTVTPGLPQVGCHCLVRPCLFLLLPVLFQAVITAQDCKTSALGKLPSALCWQAFLEQLRKNRLSYAYKHGYRYCEVSTVLDLFSPVPWTKISAVMLVLSFADVVVHMHPDALIRNDSITIESIIDVPHHNGSFKDVIYSSALGSSRVVEPSMKVAIDTGVFIVKSTAWSRVVPATPAASFASIPCLVPKARHSMFPLTCSLVSCRPTWKSCVDSSELPCFTGFQKTMR